MIIHNFEQAHSILNQFIAELRDKEIQKDAMRFRKNVERIGEILGYEMSKTLAYHKHTVHTPFGKKESFLPNNDLVLCSILRAGLPLHQGLLNFYDKAENAFISAFRHHLEADNSFEIIVKYLAAPSIEGKTLILADPMLATGKTLENVYKAILKHGQPKQIHIISIIGSQVGVDYIASIFPKNTHLWIPVVDEILNEKGYIIPGLGDAGDLSFGLKL